MKNIYFLFLMIVVVGMCEKTHAQSRWIGIMPMEYNPSFAGNSGGHRSVAFAGYTSSEGGRKSYKGDDHLFPKTSTPVLGVSYDNFIPKIASGVGFFASWMHSHERRSRDDLKVSGLKTGIVISPKISLKGKYTIAPSLGLTYKYSEGEYWDLYKSKYEAFNLSVGLLFNTERFYLGYANYYNPFKGEDILLFFEDFKQTKVYGWTYGLIQTGFKYQRTKMSKTSYTLQAVFRIREYTTWIGLVNNISLTVKHNKLLFGVTAAEGVMGPIFYTPPQDELHVGIGYQTSKFKIFYSQDLINLKFRYRSEITCRLLLPKKGKVISQF
ncbi:hypothetical protein MYP_445 [Sporocytophaga myxococcoides]|uniref:Uncharacterized protein n=1 Tax=Sporocytophaga myxococcoides TaxID=153721 RepID=A0A098L9V9_9BACT|nr:hypothetical protein [Sporocytophaga myxococcoides]GAL83219.1 hypothetical protein MYP_445 [Sporocytophaga myxococcoides]